MTPAHWFLRDIGAPAERIAKRAGLSTEQFDRPDALVPFHLACAYIGAAARSAGIPNLGALAGFSFPTFSFGAYGQALASSPTFYDVVRTAIRLLPSFSSAYRLWYLEDGQQIWLCERYSGAADDGCAQVDAFSLASIVDCIRTVAGPDWRPKQMRAPARARAAIDGIDAWADTDIEFTRDLIAVAFPRRFLLARLPSLEERSADEAATTLLHSAPPRGFLDAISAIIRASSAIGPPNLTRVAKAAGMSVRSLQRQFTESHVTFSELVAQTRLACARDLLQDPGVKAIDVALELGYSDPANFSRAFRRWTGASPSEYRLSLTRTGT